MDDNPPGVVRRERVAGETGKREAGPASPGGPSKWLLGVAPAGGVSGWCFRVGANGALRAGGMPAARSA